MRVLKNWGCKPMMWNPWLACNTLESMNEFNLALASNYKIKEFYGLELDDNIIKTMKEALYHKLPLTIGMGLTESFTKIENDKTGLWKPSDTEKIAGYHAMSIIGYDDIKFGGSFEVMNSYGASFGDNGFVWIKYADMKKYLDEVYLFEIEGMKAAPCSFGDCENSYSRYSFEDGNIYEGTLEKKLAEGYGAYIYKNGDFYVGSFEKGRKNGQGLYFDANLGQYFDVSFNQDVMVSKNDLQGFVGMKETINTKEICSILQKMLPGKLIQEEDEIFETFKAKYEVPENKIELKIK
jgi:hypothetical protein